MRRHHILLLILAFMPAACHAQTKCPWINEATARGVLGGTVTVTVKVNDQGAGVREFRASKNPPFINCASRSTSWPTSPNNSPPTSRNAPRRALLSGPSATRL